MPREQIANDTPLKNAVIADTGHSVYLIRLEYRTGAGASEEVRLTNAPVDLSLEVESGLGAETWNGGLLLNVAVVTESDDLDASGVDVTLDGVNQTIIAVLMDNHFRGQNATIYKGWYDPSAGTLLGSYPLLMFRGLQNEAYNVSETSTDLPDAVQVTTRVIGRVTRPGSENVVRTNPEAHLSYLVRGGLSDTTANFFIFTAQVAGLPVYWGQATPANAKSREWDHGLYVPPGGDDPWTYNGPSRL